MESAMRVALTTRHLAVTKALHHLVQRRANFAFARFAGRLKEVRLRLVGDGPLVVCLATARVLPGEIVTVRGTYATAESAIVDVCERLRQRIVRSIERRRALARG